MNFETMNFETTNNNEKVKVADKIAKRLEVASEKIKQRVVEKFIPTINRFKDDEEVVFYLDRLRNDFENLAENPDDECGGGQYQDWTSEEIKELYEVLYGEKID